MFKKRIVNLSVAVSFALYTIFSSTPVLAKNTEGNIFVEEENSVNITVADEIPDYDEVNESKNVVLSDELMRANGYVRITEEEKRQMIENNPCDTGIEIGQIPDYYLSESATGEGSSRSLQHTYTNSYQILNVIGQKYNNTDFVNFLINGEIKTPTDETEDYISLQGGCFDGTYYYFGFLLKDKSEDGKIIDARLVRGRFDSDGDFVTTVFRCGLLSKLQHINDLTFNKDTGELVIVCCEANYHNRIYTIPTSSLSQSTTIDQFEEHLLPCMVTAIEYNSTRAQYVARLSGCAEAYAILDTDFNLVKTFGSSADNQYGWATQGICADNLYIYSLSFFQGTSSGNTDEKYLVENENRLRIFDWDGNLIKSFEFRVDKDLETPNSSDKRIYEFENIMIANDRLLIGANCIPKEDGGMRTFAFLDMSKWTYHIQFCPDEQVDLYAGQYGNGNVSAIMFRNVSTPLRKFRVSSTNKNFTGWTAYRVDDKMWLYCNEDRSVKQWCLPGDQPPGYKKYTYADKQSVSQTGEAGDHVLMCAQWESANDTFTVSFMKNGGNGTMSDQIVTYGKGASLNTNTFNKTGRSFVGWNAYWVEKNRWYYVSADGLTKGWYKEGYEPAGYKKYTYANGQNVKTTVYAGGHVYMYALWDEYYIQYALNQDEDVKTNKMISPSRILEQETAYYAANAKNYISKVQVTYEHDGEEYVASNITMEGYHLYRKEIDKWMYIKGSTKGWYSYGNAPSGYTLYMRTVPKSNASSAYLGATALPGEHLILVAVWSDSQ